jgi:serine protease Do
LLLAAGASEKGWLGVSVEEMTPSMRDDYKLGARSGLLVNHVFEGSPADDAGLHEDEVILTYDGIVVDRQDEFSRLVRQTPPGKSVTISIFRDGEEKPITVEIAKRKIKVSSPAYWGGEHYAFRLDRPRLGVQIHELSEDLAPYFKVEKNNGVLISQVTEDSPAEAAGLKAGDVIVKIDDEKISDPDDIFNALENYEAGDKVTVEYIRKGVSEKTEVELEKDGFREFHIGPRNRIGKLRIEKIPHIPDVPHPPVIIEDFRHRGKSI